MSAHEGTPLTSISGWHQTHIKKLAKNWITTAEQVVGIGATSEGLRTLADQPGVSTAEIRRLVNSARDALSPAVAAELREAVDTSQYGLGALPPEAQPDPGAGVGDKRNRKGGKTS